MTAVDHKEALYRVGRNLLNFQKLEHILKIALPSISFSSQGKDINSALESEARRFKNQTLGHLTHTLDKKLFDPHTEDENNSNPPFFSFSLKLVLAEEHRIAYKKKWLGLVKSRNALIHHQLVHVDFESAEECTRLCNALDEQNREICAQYEEVLSLFETIKGACDMELVSLTRVEVPSERGST